MTRRLFACLGTLLAVTAVAFGQTTAVRISGPRPFTLSAAELAALPHTTV